MRSNRHVYLPYSDAGSHFRALPSQNEGAKMAAISCSAASKWPLEQPKGAGAQHFCALGKQGERAKTLPEAPKWLRAAISGLPQRFHVLSLIHI